MLTFRGHSGDVNSVTFFPDGNAIGTGSDDTSCRIFDMRCASELGAFGTPKIISGITSGGYRCGRMGVVVVVTEWGGRVEWWCGVE